MTVRRVVARLAVVGALLGGVLVAGATPALADDSVRVRASSSFTAGGSAGAVSIEVRRRGDGCVLLRTGLRLRLDGVRADQVEVRVAAGGQWWPVPVSGEGLLTTSRTSPANPTLCKGKSITVKYRLAFLPGAPAGRLTVAGEAVTASGKPLGRNADTALVKAGRKATPSPTPTKEPTPTPTPEVTEESATEDPTAEPTLVAAGAGGGQAAEDSSGGGMSLVMVFGVGMVVVGGGLILLLFRRSRAERGKHTDAPFAGAPGSPLPRHAGGTTYRSGGGHPAPGAGTTYPASGPGHPPAPPPPSGTVYPASSGTVYPPSSGMVHPPSSGTVYPASRTGGPGTPPPPAAAGGDATALMPRLPE